jgi:hypothetical protein
MLTVYLERIWILIGLQVKGNILIEDNNIRSEMAVRLDYFKPIMMSLVQEFIFHLLLQN